MENFWISLEGFFQKMSLPTWQDYFVRGLQNTVSIAVLGLLIGIVIGTLIAVIEVAPKYSRLVRFGNLLCRIYVAVFRGTPMVSQLLIAYYLLLPALGIKGVQAVTVGIVVFGMNSGAYVSEIMRSGINSVDIGQMEAGRALGLSYPTTMLRIVVPQAVKNIIPTIGNEFITLIKETSVLSFITVFDLYTMFKLLVAATYDEMIPYLAMALIYIVLVLGITLLIKLLEGLMAKSDRNRKGGKSRAKRSAA